jgi:hypothetical protein
MRFASPDAENRRVAVRAEPPLAGLTVRNTLKFANAECGDWKGNARAAFASSGDKAEATFAGAYSLTCGEQNWYVSLMNHPGYVGGAFRPLWQEAGGTLAGQVKDGSAPAARLFATLTSPQLAEIVRDINSSQQRDGQAFVPDHRRAIAPGRPARRARSAVAERRARFLNWSWKTAPGSRGSSASAPSI